MKIKLYLCGFLLGMTGMLHAQSFYPMRHVIVNQTTDTVFYQFQFVEDSACDSINFIKPGHTQQIECQKDGMLFSPGIYKLNIEQVYFYGKRTVRCSASRVYPIKKHKKLVIWKLSKRCQVDIIET